MRERMNCRLVRKRSGMIDRELAWVALTSSLHEAYPPRAATTRSLEGLSRKRPMLTWPSSVVVPEASSRPSVAERTDTGGGGGGWSREGKVRRNGGEIRARSNEETSRLQHVEHTKGTAPHSPHARQSHSTHRTAGTAALLAEHSNASETGSTTARAPQLGHDASRGTHLPRSAPRGRRSGRPRARSL